MAHEDPKGFARFAPFLSDALSLICILIALSVAWGKFDERVSKLEQQRMEMREDMRVQFQAIQHSMDRIDDKLTTLLRERK